jgi:predicted amidophosphoribosyltransferase
MRDRHFPRLCRTCRAPMARQEETCWRCGAPWASEDAPPTRLKVLAGGARAASDARQDADRWANEGGSLAFEAATHAR